MSKATRRVHKFNFEDNMGNGNAAHVALVDKAANKQEVLVMKSAKEVVVQLSMKEFLKKFMGMWEEDAATLAGIMGYSSEVYNNYLKEDGSYMTDQEYVDSKIANVTLLKSVDLEELKTLPESIHSIVSDLQKKYQGALDEASVKPEDNLDEDLSSDINKSKEVSMELTKEQIEDLQKQAEEAKNLRDSLDILKSEMQGLKEEKEAKAKADMTDLVKGFSFVDKEDKEALVATLLKSEDGVVLVSSLEKAQKAILAATTVEVGDEGEDLTKADTESDVNDRVADLLKARKKD